MKKEKAPENLEKQGRGLTIFLKILGVILLLLNLLLLDQEFVPWGKTWEELKLNRPEETVGMTDKELWTFAKETFVEGGLVPFNSGFLCWGVCLYMWNEQKAEEAEREKQFLQAREGAETVIAVVNEFLSENEINTYSHMDPGIYPPYITFELQCTRGSGWWGAYYFLDERERGDLEEKLRAAFPDRNFSVTAVVLGEKCTAAAFTEDFTLLSSGTDYPRLDENGHFDTEQLWGYGYHTAIVGYVDEIMLESEEEENSLS